MTLSEQPLERPAAPRVPTNTHILTSEFDLLTPSSLDEALRLLTAGAAPMAGGTDLLVQMKLERSHPSTVVSLARVRELGRIVSGDESKLGATVTIADVAEASIVGSEYTALSEACRAFSTVAIMAMGTLGGNLCNASPASDTAPALLAFDAVLELRSREGRREVALHEFFVGPGRTVLRPGELLTSVRLPPPPVGSGSAFLKVGRVEADIAKVCVAVSVVSQAGFVRDCRIAFGSVAPTPVRVQAAEGALIGGALTPSAIAEAQSLVRQSISPITDQRSSAEYRSHVAGVIMGDALRTAWERSGGPRVGS